MVVMVDGFGIDYYDQTRLPTLNQLEKQGFFKRGKSIFPSLTNANNISIACGTWPEKHGVTTNSYFNEATGTAEFLEDASFLCSETIFQKALKHNIRSALLTCKSKTTQILGHSAELAIAAESPDQVSVERYGNPPGMYSTEVNYWLCNIALDLLKNRPEFGLIYLHTTDYPMHMWPPESPESKDHLLKLDQYLGKFLEVDPNLLVIVTADHGMNFKTRCWDLSKACHKKGLDLRLAISPVADRLIRHHRGFGGVSYVHLFEDKDETRARDIILQLEGVVEVLSRIEAAERFRLMPSRIGDLVILPDKNTVFGDLETELEILSPEYRSHGSLYETDVPLFIYNAKRLPDISELQYNLDLTRALF